MSETPALPHVVDLVPPGMQLRVHRHTPAELGRACWSYLSLDLGRRGQRELALTLASEEADDAAGLLPTPLSLFKALGEAAQQGRTVAQGGFTLLGESGLFGRPELRGLCYVPGIADPQVPGLGEALSMIPLTVAELAVVQTLGPGRILARLGQAHRCFPYPRWVDRGRSSVALSGEIARSVLANVASLWVPGGYASKVGGAVVLSLPRSFHETLAEHLTQLPREAALVLLTMVAPEASAALCWRPGQTQASAYAAPGAGLSMLGGAFCLLVPEQKEIGGQLLEDGFALTFDDAGWTTMRRALMQAEPLRARGTGLSIELRWTED